MRIAVLGPPVARPVDFVEAFLGTDREALRSECEEHGPWRIVTVEAMHAGRLVRLGITVAPRQGAADACRAALESSDAAIVLIGAGGWAEQEPVLADLTDCLRGESGGRAGTRARRPLVLVVNEYLPPRLRPDPEAEDWARSLRAEKVLRGRLCWWRHERSGTDLTRQAVDAAVGLLRQG